MKRTLIYIEPRYGKEDHRKAYSRVRCNGMKPCLNEDTHKLERVQRAATGWATALKNMNYEWLIGTKLNKCLRHQRSYSTIKRFSSIG